MIHSISESTHNTKSTNSIASSTKLRTRHTVNDSSFNDHSLYFPTQESINHVNTMLQSFAVLNKNLSSEKLPKPQRDENLSKASWGVAENMTNDKRLESICSDNKFYWTFYSDIANVLTLLVEESTIRFSKLVHNVSPTVLMDFTITGQQKLGYMQFIIKMHIESIQQQFHNRNDEDKSMQYSLLTALNERECHIAMERLFKDHLTGFDLFQSTTETIRIKQVKKSVNYSPLPFFVK